MTQVVGSQMSRASSFRHFLTFIAGLGGLLYGVDIGIVSAALLYLDKTINLSVGQTSLIVAAVLAGSTCSSLVAGMLADWFGRRTMMTASGLLFVLSGALIAFSHSFTTLFLGRLIQGLSCGVIAVVVPLYLAESLSAKSRGRVSSIFQLMLTIGIVLASVVGWFYTRQAEGSIVAAHGNVLLIHAAQDHAWRSMFLSLIYPGLLFFAGSLFLSESPRWLFKRGRREEAFQALSRNSSEQEAELQIEEMTTLASQDEKEKSSGETGSLLQRRYVLPFLLACVILMCNQATGINSILSYLVVILKQAGMTAERSTQLDFVLKLLNCIMTVVAVMLIDKKGRRFLLMIGSAGIIIALTTGAITFRQAESKRTDMAAQVQAVVHNNAVDSNLKAFTTSSQPMEMMVSYNYGDGKKMAAVLSTENNGALKIAPADAKSRSLVIEHAWLGPIPSERSGNLIALCIAFFIASFAVGPGVVVWLTLSELMPMRIRSNGMGIALLLNQGVSTAIAGVFLPVTGSYGYAAMFGFWALCTVVYFLTAVFFLPETKGKTLEEIEMSFRGNDKNLQAS
ncbi:MAG: MFS transporter [Acidobacteriaceae bacterium]|nr:MFS transporter [Acidobacteriaceae bacterium]